MSRRTRNLAVLAGVAVLTAVLTTTLVRALPVPHRTDGIPTITKQAAPVQSLVTLLQAMRDRAQWANITFGSGSAGLIRIAEEFNYTINGVNYQKGRADDIASSISGTALTTAQAAIFRIEINSSGTVSSVQGPIVTAASADPPIPPRSANKATLGWVHVTGYTFTPGTTTLNNAAVTFFNGDPDLTESLLATP